MSVLCEKLTWSELLHLSAVAFNTDLPFEFFTKTSLRRFREIDLSPPLILTLCALIVDCEWM